MTETSALSRRGNVLAWVVPIMLLLCCCGVLLIGCGGGSQNNNGDDPAPVQRGPVALELLISAYDMTPPANLEIDADPGFAAGLLNQWRLAQIQESGEDRVADPLSEPTREYLQKYLGEEAVSVAERDDFTARDAKHIRNARFAKMIAMHVADRISDDLDRANAVFDYLSRNIELVSEADALALTPFEILMFGQGTAEDRAWLFAEMLRQLNLDTVIVKPESGNGPLWFVGVVSKKTIYVYYPLVSIPVPGPGVKLNQPFMPATLGDLAKEDTWKNLGSNPNLAKEFEKPRLEIIGNADLWSPRLANLQSFLTGNRSVVVAQPLFPKTDGQSTVLDRIAALGPWTEADLTPWSHPEERLAKGEGENAFSEEWQPFQAPQEVLFDVENQRIEIAPQPSWFQRDVRLDQLLGQQRDAVRGYLKVQLDARKLPPTAQIPGNIRVLHAKAAEDASFWSGICQFELGNPSTAVTKFRSYLEEVQGFYFSGRHTDQAKILLAKSLVATNDTEQALRVLQTVDTKSAAFPTAAVMFSHLTQFKPGPDKEPEPKPEPKKPTEETTPSKSDSPAIAEKPQK